MGCIIFIFHTVCFRNLSSLPYRRFMKKKNCTKQVIFTVLYEASRVYKYNLHFIIKLYAWSCNTHFREKKERHRLKLFELFSLVIH